MGSTALKPARRSGVGPGFNSLTVHSFTSRLMAGRWVLVPEIGVRVLGGELAVGCDGRTLVS